MITINAEGGFSVLIFAFPYGWLIYPIWVAFLKECVPLLLVWQGRGAFCVAWIYPPCYPLGVRGEI